MKKRGLTHEQEKHERQNPHGCDVVERFSRTRTELARKGLGRSRRGARSGRTIATNKNKQKSNKKKKKKHQTIHSRVDGTQRTKKNKTYRKNTRPEITRRTRLSVFVLVIFSARYGFDDGPFGCGAPLKHMHARWSGLSVGPRRPKTGSRVSADVLHGNYRAPSSFHRARRRGQSSSSIIVIVVPRIPV